MADKEEKTASRKLNEGFQDLFSKEGRTTPGKDRDRGPDRVSVEQDGLAQSLWLKSLEDKAREEGYRIGYQEGFSRGLEDAAEIRNDLEAWSDLLPRLLGEELEKKTDLLSTLVLSAVTRLLGDTLVRPEGVQSLVETLIAQWGENREADLSFSPEMFAWLERHLPDWFAGLSSRNIHPVARGGLSGTDIRLSVRDQAVTFSLKQSLEDLDARLREVMAQ
ncbi:hypothetical protein [Leptospirillum ferriphilum]|jgi:hypothetical protein|uniref:Flagellar assembly protein FliH/Type III secretion system HrpE domain-containing protein n=3 Tax=Leptospirillum ferriphilum TaxID=178606 RepID=A0A059XWD7_9BACT|nr:hypothetical protein [Leptospirillum ferriphilum]AFS52474.1 hypothetical protein LFML04_0229 [Leptospirillum ferriphilum ML-04]AIA31415.1 hypothetical protein Y981_01270 [Leptospirillum ferriphilum YSK]OOH69685.1 hypothetical protein BOX24_11715 [Leptospirillum ferriphilum]OOH83908.1 hypothetical protein BOX30_01425 [Leptospirillum ferriphilum]